MAQDFNNSSSDLICLVPVRNARVSLFCNFLYVRMISVLLRSCFLCRCGPVHPCCFSALLGESAWSPWLGTCVQVSEGNSKPIGFYEEVYVGIHAIGSLGPRLYPHSHTSAAVTHSQQVCMGAFGQGLGQRKEWEHVGTLAEM